MVITPFIIPLCGPLALHGYGIVLCIAVLAVLIGCAYTAKKELNITYETTLTIIERATLSGLFGARILEIISNPQAYPSLYDKIAIWDGGLSLLGCVIILCLVIPLILYRKKIPLLPALDIASRFAPLGNAIGRLGCLWAGCCYGIPALTWGISYSGKTSGAPTQTLLLPTQLYSSLLFFLLFIVLNVIAMKFKTKPGTLTLVYLTGLCIERFFIDFIRNDRVEVIASSFSFHQWVALALLVTLLLLFQVRRHLSNRQHTP